LNELTEKFKPNELYILKAATTMFKVTDPFKKDDRGFNKPEAWLFKAMLERDVNEFRIENLEWIRRSLLKYKVQLSDLGFDMSMLTAPVAEKAIYGWQTLADSKFLGAEVSFKKNVKIIFRWRLFKNHSVEKIRILLNREEGIQFLIEMKLIASAMEVSDPTSTPYISELKVSYTQESSRELLTKFNLLENPAVFQSKPQKG